MSVCSEVPADGSSPTTAQAPGSRLSFRVDSAEMMLQDIKDRPIDIKALRRRQPTS